MYKEYMSPPVAKPRTIGVADEVFLVVADLHRLHPEVDDFSVKEIMDHQKLMNLAGTLRPGFEIHVRQHGVANLPPNPGRYRILFASGRARRRLLLPGDEVHPRRTGKIWPEPDAVPAQYRGLVQWARERFGSSFIEAVPLRELRSLRGSGREIWQDEHADDYVRRLRQDWP